MKPKTIVPTVLALCLLARVSLGQQSSPPISTDRPSESAGTGIVPVSSFQFEMGFKHDRGAGDENARVTTRLVPDLLARIGLHDRLEGRVTVSGWSFQDSPSASGSGFNDVSVGAKWALRPATSGRSTPLSLLAELSLPVGSENFTSDRVNPKLLILLERGLSDSIGLTANFGTSVLRAHSTGHEERTVVDLPYTTLVGYGATDDVSIFVEVFGAFSLQGRDDTHSVQAGLTARVKDHVQVDARVGVGLVDGAPSWLAGAGIAFRLQ